MSVFIVCFVVTVTVICIDIFLMLTFKELLVTNDFPNHYEIDNGYSTGEWTEEIEVTYVISKVTFTVNEDKSHWDGMDYDELVTEYKIGLVNKDNILDTDMIIVPEEIYNPEIYKVGKEVKITKMVIARN